MFLLDACAGWEGGAHIPHQYLGVLCTYKLLSNCSYNQSIRPVTTVTLDMIGLYLQLLSSL